MSETHHDTNANLSPEDRWARLPSHRTGPSVHDLALNVLRAIPHQISDKDAYRTKINLVMLASGTTRNLDTDGQANTKLLTAVRHLIQEGRVVQVASVLAFARARMDVLMQLPGVTPEAAAAATTLGAAIATAPPAALTPIVDDVFRRGWVDVAPFLSLIDRHSDDPAVLPLTYRQQIAEEVDSFAKANPGYLEEVREREIALAFSGDGLDDVMEEDNGSLDGGVDDVCEDQEDFVGPVDEGQAAEGSFVEGSEDTADAEEPEDDGLSDPAAVAEVDGSTHDEGFDADRSDEAGTVHRSVGSRNPPGDADAFRQKGATTPPVPEYRPMNVLLCEPPPPRPLLCGKILERGVVTGLVAAPGSGKTSLGIQLTVALAQGKTWAGLTIRGPLRIVYVNTEENLDEKRRRFKGVAKMMEADDPDVMGRILTWSGGRMRLMEKQDGAAALTPAFENLRSAVLTHRADVVVLDPAALSHGLEENSNLDTTDFIEALKDLARDCDCAMLLAHHTRKESGDKPTMDSARGASAVPASFRIMMMLMTVPAPSPKAGQPGPEERPAQVELHVVKANNSKKRDRLAVFEWDSVDLENGKDGEPSDDVGVLIPLS